MTGSNPSHHQVIYDPDAVAELLTMKSREEHSALLHAVLKLRELGELLGPPHMKPLKGAAALRELRPKQGRSDWRARTPPTTFLLPMEPATKGVRCPAGARRKQDHW